MYEFQKIISLVNKLKADGLISDYCLGGTTAFVYYWEPVQTQHLDIFVVLTNQTGVLVNLAPIYQFCADNGISASGEYLLFGHTPVQLLVPYNPLVEEAVVSSREVKYLGEVVRIPPLEYLMAIMLQTGRVKDKARLSEIFSLPELFDSKEFERIVIKFGLTEQHANIAGRLSQ